MSSLGPRTTFSGMCSSLLLVLVVSSDSAVRVAPCLGHAPEAIATVNGASRSRLERHGRFHPASGAGRRESGASAARASRPAAHGRAVSAAAGATFAPRWSAASSRAAATAAPRTRCLPLAPSLAAILATLGLVRQPLFGEEVLLLRRERETRTAIGARERLVFCHGLLPVTAPPSCVGAASSRSGSRSIRPWHATRAAGGGQKVAKYNPVLRGCNNIVENRPGTDRRLGKTARSDQPLGVPNGRP